MSAMIADDHLVNYELLKMVSHLTRPGTIKQAFIPGGDPSMGAPPEGGGGAPMDPAAMGGGGGGGAPPPEGGGGGGSDPALQQILQLLQTMQQGGAGGAGPASGAALKPKIDVNVELMQIKNILAKVVDHLGIQIPAQDMVATPDKLMAMSQGQNPASGAQGGAAGGQAGGAIGPMGPMDGMQGSGVPGAAAGAQKTGSYMGRNGVAAIDTRGLGETVNRAEALAQIFKARKAS